MIKNIVGWLLVVVCGCIFFPLYWTGLILGVLFYIPLKEGVIEGSKWVADFVINKTKNLITK